MVVDNISGSFMRRLGHHTLSRAEDPWWGRAEAMEHVVYSRLARKHGTEGPSPPLTIAREQTPPGLLPPVRFLRALVVTSGVIGGHGFVTFIRR